MMDKESMINTGILIVLVIIILFLLFKRKTPTAPTENFTLMNSLPSGYIPCGAEGNKCNAEGTNTVYYGAGNKYYSKNFTGPFTCSISKFGQDPDPYVAKMCYVPWNKVSEENEDYPVNTTLQESLPSGYTECGKEGQTCNATGANLVYYGANNKYFSKYTQGPFTCDISLFQQNDPANGIVKSCYLPPAPLPLPLPPASEAEEEARKTVPPITNPNPNPPANNETNLLGKYYVKCSDEGQRCSPESEQETVVVYGGDGGYTARQIIGGFDCNSDLFGDPNPGNPKSCYIIS